MGVFFKGGLAGLRAMKIWLLLSMGLFVAVCSSLSCGVVNDGLKLDVDIQASTTKLSASWSGFEDGKERNRILRYEWAVVSSSYASGLKLELAEKMLDFWDTLMLLDGPTSRKQLLLVQMLN